MKTFFILAVVLVTTCVSASSVHHTSDEQSDGNIANSFARYGSCIEDRRSLRSFLIGLKHLPGGQMVVDTLIAFETAMAKEIPTIRAIPNADVILKELKTLLTSNLPTDKRMINPETLVDFNCVLQTTLDLLENDKSFQDFVAFLSRPAQIAAFKRLEASADAHDLAQVIRHAGVGVDSIANIFHNGFLKISREYSTPVEKFASAFYKELNCSNCPGCTACLQCCLVKNYM